MHPLEDPRTKLADISAGLHELAGVRAGGLAPNVLADLSLELYKLTDLLDAVRAEITSECTRTLVPTHDGLKRMSDFVANNTPSATAPVSRDDAIGSWARRFPIIHAAGLAGDMHRERLKVIKKCDTHRTRDAFRDAQELFVFIAKHTDWKGFEKCIGYWMALNDPDGDMPKEQHDDRTATLNKDGSTGVVSGSLRFDAMSGQAVQTAVNQEIKRLQAEDNETGQTRTWQQLTADAISNLIQRGAARKDRTLPAPLVHILMGYRTARELCLRFDPQPGDPEPSPGPIPVNPSDPDWRCELIDGTPIHPFAAYKYLGQAQIRGIVLDASAKRGCFDLERVVDLSKLVKPQGRFGANRLRQLMGDTPSVPLGSNARGFPPQLAQAAMIAGRATCRVSGCNAQAHWLQVDHHHPHSRGGRTHLDNAHLLCGHDNGKKSNHLPGQPPQHYRVPARK